MQSVSLSPAMR